MEAVLLFATLILRTGLIYSALQLVNKWHENATTNTVLVSLSILFNPPKTNSCANVHGYEGRCRCGYFF